VIKKDGTKTSEKKWVCRFCEKPFQGGPNVIQAHHGVHGTGKKKAIQLCKHTPADVKARLQQEMSITLRSIAEKETSEVIQIVRQQEDHVARMENAGVELSMLVESGQLKLAFPRVPAFADGGERCAYVGDIFRVELHSYDSERAEPGSRQ
jgi:hypothetical protein